MKENTRIDIKVYDKIHTRFEISHVQHIGYSSMKTKHFHDAFEIYYLFKGERYYFINDRIYHLKKGDLVFIDVHSIHKTNDADIPDHERILIAFKKAYLNNILIEAGDYDLFSCFHKNTNILRLNEEDQTFIEQLLFKMLAENNNPTDGSLIHLKIMLAEFLIFSGRLFQNTPNYVSENSNPMYSKISEVITHINKNYMQDLTLDSIAKTFFISTWYLSRTFKKITGLNLNEYINNVKIREAQLLLSSTKLNITKISETVGYDSPTHFGRVFKSITGVSPLKYRKTLPK